jgi:hypothetical protein
MKLITILKFNQWQKYIFVGLFETSSFLILNSPIFKPLESYKVTELQGFRC